jgi:hypothetical protein
MCWTPTNSTNRNARRNQQRAIPSHACPRDKHDAATGTLSAIAHYAGTMPGNAKSTQELDMNKLTIKDLAVSKELDKHQMTRFSGGMGRTPQQILAWEITGKPATWQGLVLEDDNRLHVPAI